MIKQLKEGDLLGLQCSQILRERLF